MKERLIAVGLIATAVVFAAFALYALAFPFALDYGEGPLLDQARRLAAGESIYRLPGDHGPWVISNYPPLYPAVLAALSRLGLPLLALGRAVSIAATLACALLVAVLSRRLFQTRAAGWLGAALFLGHVFVVEWGLVARVDMLALAFSLGALALVVARAPGWRGVALATTCALLAVFTRQTYGLAAPVAVAVALWRTDRSKAAAFVAGLALATGAGAWWLDRATGGGFRFHVLLANVNHYQWLRALEFGGRFVAVTGIAVALALTVRPRRELEPNARAALVAYTACAVAVALTVGKVGSWHNYFLELTVAIALWGAAAARPAAPARATPLVALQLAFCVVSTSALLAWKLSPGWQNRAGYARIAGEVRAARGPVLADDAMTMIAEAGGAVHYQPFEYRQLQTTGRWDPAPIVADVLSARFPLIVLRWPDTRACRERWGPEILAAVRARYHESIRAGALVSYVPR